MPDAYPYTIANGKVNQILARVRTAAKPARFNRELLNTWGFAASNDRAIVSILKELGFLNESGVPTELYDRLRDPNDWRYVLAERIKYLYADLFAINGEINSAPDDEIKGAISRITGKEEETVKRYFLTFKALTSLANFEPKAASAKENGKGADEEKKGEAKVLPPPAAEEHRRTKQSEYHYNIQIHLPTTTDISVYNAIFKSLRENLGV